MSEISNLKVATGLAGPFAPVPKLVNVRSIKTDWSRLAVGSKTIPKSRVVPNRFDGSPAPSLFGEKTVWHSASVERPSQDSKVGGVGGGGGARGVVVTLIVRSTPSVGSE